MNKLMVIDWASAQPIILFQIPVFALAIFFAWRFVRDFINDARKNGLCAKQSFTDKKIWDAIKAIYFVVVGSCGAWLFSLSLFVLINGFVGLELFHDPAQIILGGSVLLPLIASVDHYLLTGAR